MDINALKAKLTIAGAGQTVTVSFDTVRKNLPEVLALVRELLRAPTFPATEFEQLRSENLTMIEASRNEPTAVGSKEIARVLNRYPKGDVRYAPSSDGDFDAC